MTDTTSHLGVMLQDFLDDRLDTRRRAEVQAHLDGCRQCRGELEALRWVRDSVLKQLPAEAVPPGLAGRVAGALDAEDGRARPPAPPTIRPRWRRWAGAGVGALIAAAALVVLLVSPARVNLPEAVARDFAEYAGGKLALDLRSTDGDAVEDFFAARGIDFKTRVFDLGMMRYQLAGGGVHHLGNRVSALFAYRGPDGQDLVCQIYEGRLAALPPPDDVRTQDGIRFQVYRVGQITLVFWQEGEVVCVLASDGGFEDVIRLAYAKAVKV